MLQFLVTWRMQHSLEPLVQFCSHRVLDGGSTARGSVAAWPFLLTHCSTMSLQKAVAVQLLPYGWEIKEGPRKGSTVREDLYKSMVLGLNATYFGWVNHDPMDAFLRRRVFFA